jgi:putative peptidoglycan lipid II flippase
MIPLGHAGLALATIIAAGINSVLLLRGLLRGALYRPLPGWRPLLAKGVCASAAMGAVLWIASGQTPEWTDWTTSERVKQLTLLIVAGSFSYAVAALALGLRPRHLRQINPNRT